MEEAEIDLGVLQVRIVGELSHYTVAVAECEVDIVGRAFNVLRDQNVGALLANADQAWQVKLAADGNAAIGEIDVRNRGLAHANVDERDDLLDFRKQGCG